MFLSTTLTLLYLISIALSGADAIPFLRRSGKINLSLRTGLSERGVLNVVEQDRARAQSIVGGTSQEHSEPARLANSTFIYVTEVGVGTPPTQYSLVLDTGSSNTWVGAGKKYVKTATSQYTGDAVRVRYGSGNFTGWEYLDTVTLSPQLVVDKQSIGVANQTSGFDGLDGILGVGPIELTKDKVGNESTVPTVMDNLYKQGKTSEEVLGVLLEPMSNTSTGEITYGGYDYDAITTAVQYVPVTTSSPSSKYWGIDTSITYGSEPILSGVSGIVDTGTTLLLVDSDGFARYKNVTGATMDTNIGLLKINTEQYKNLKPLSFRIGENTYNLTPNAQLFPRSLNTLLGASSDSIYLAVSELPAILTKSEPNLNVICGTTFLTRFYSVYDTTNRRIGFAETRFTNSEVN